MKFVLGLFSGAFALVVWCVVVLAIPFNVIAMMRLFGWEWWSCLIVAILASAIPFIGQLAFIVFAILGAYYFVSSGFDWQKATRANAGTYSVASLSLEEFEKYKRDVLSPPMKQACLNDKRVQATKFNGNYSEKSISFCDCYASFVLGLISQNDVAIGGDNMPADFSKRLETNYRGQCGSLI